LQNKFSNNEPYAPAEDTFFLEDNLFNEKGKYALDIGTGSGYLTSEALNCKFDLIVCNMPYLQSDEISDRRVDGGKEGVEIPLKIIKSAVRCLNDSGKMLFVTSSLANYEKLMDESKKLGLDMKIVARKKLFFEELLLVEAR